MLSLQELADLRAKHTSTNEEGVETFDATAYDSELLQISQTKEGQIRSAERKAEREKFEKGRKSEEENKEASKSGVDLSQLSDTIASAVNEATSSLKEELNTLKAEREQEQALKQGEVKKAEFIKRANQENVQNVFIEQIIANTPVDNLESIDLTIYPKNEGNFKKQIKKKGNGEDDKSPKGRRVYGI